MRRWNECWNNPGWRSLPVKVTERISQIGSSGAGNYSAPSPVLTAQPISSFHVSAFGSAWANNHLPPLSISYTPLVLTVPGARCEAGRLKITRAKESRRRRPQSASPARDQSDQRPPFARALFLALTTSLLFRDSLVLPLNSLGPFVSRRSIAPVGEGLSQSPQSHLSYDNICPSFAMRRSSAVMIPSLQALLISSTGSVLRSKMYPLSCALIECVCVVSTCVTRSFLLGRKMT
jgi:hypothetical protein